MTAPPRLARRDVLVALAAFWAITSLAFTAGRWFVPSFGVSSVEEALAGSDADPEQLREARLFDLRTALGQPQSAVAALDATGTLQGRHLLENLDGFGLSEDEGSGYEVSLRMRGGNVVLAITGASLPAAIPLSEGFSVTISAPGVTFFSKPGECTLELTTVDTVVIGISGWLQCDITSTRTGATLAFLAAFSARPGGV